MEFEIAELENGLKKKIIDIDSEKSSIYLNDNVLDKLTTLYMYANMCYIASIKGVVIQDILKDEFIKYDKKIKNDNNKINACEYISGYLERLTKIDNYFVQEFALSFVNDVESLYEENSKYIEVVNDKPLSFDNKVEVINYLIGYSAHLLEKYYLRFDEDYIVELNEEIENKLIDILDEKIVSNNVDYDYLCDEMQFEIVNLLYEKIDYSKIISELDLVLLAELDEDEIKLYKLYLPMQLACINGLKISRKNVSEYLGLSQAKTKHKTVTFLRKISKIVKLDETGKLEEYIYKKSKVKRLVK